MAMDFWHNNQRQVSSASLSLSFSLSREACNQFSGCVPRFLKAASTLARNELHQNGVSRWSVGGKCIDGGLSYRRSRCSRQMAPCFYLILPAKQGARGEFLPHRQPLSAQVCGWNSFILTLCTMKLDALINFVIRNLKYPAYMWLFMDVWGRCWTPVYCKVFLPIAL